MTKYGRSAIMAICGVAAAPLLNAAAVEDYRLSTSVAYAVAPDSGERVEQALSAAVEASVGISEALLWQVGARVWFDTAQVLRPNRDNERVFTHASRFNRRVRLGSAGDLELREFYLEWRGGRHRVRLGKQQVAWSGMDGLPTFAVNPSDYHDFILNDDAERRWPQWGLYLDVPVGEWRFEATSFFDDSVHDVPDPGSWFEFTAPQFRFGFAVDETVSDVEVDTRLPDTFRDATHALRMSRRIGNSGFALLGLTGSEHEAVGTLENGAAGPVLVRSFPRRRLAAVTVDTSFGRAVLRGELAAHWNRVFNLRRGDVLTTTELDTVALGLGVDLNLPLDVFMNLQFLVDRIQDAPAGLVKPERNDLATLTVRRAFLYEAVNVELRWYHDPDLGDSLGQASIEYSPSDAVTVELLGAWFSGDPAGRFGQFASRDLLKLALRYDF